MIYLTEDNLIKILFTETPSEQLAQLIGENLADEWRLLKELKDIPQNPEHHPEGDVLIHTLQVVDRAAQLRKKYLLDSLSDAEALMISALLHDLGKKTHTFIKLDNGKIIKYSPRNKDLGGKLVAYGHDKAGADIAWEYMQKIGIKSHIAETCVCLVRDHMSPMLYEKQRARDKTYKKLFERCNPILLGFLHWADKGVFPEKYFQRIEKDFNVRVTQWN